MIRNLTIIAVASFVLAVACLGTAFAIGGRELVEHGWRIPGNVLIEDNENGARISLSPGTVTFDEDSPSTSRMIAWSGGEALKISLPANVIYTQGPKASILVEGPESLVRRVTLDGERLRLQGDDLRIFGGSDDLIVRITAPAVKRFTLDGSGQLEILDYDQPSLDLTLNGSGEAYAKGRADVLDLRIAGSGEAELTALHLRDAKVAIAGSGDVKVGPTGEADIQIAGSGDVTLTQRPARLSKSVAGSGDVNEDW